MSIQDEIEAAKSSGALVCACPLVPWEGEPRVFLMSQELRDEIAAGRRNPNEYMRWAKLEADIGHFVAGGYINWQLLKWLDPKKYEHWELRSVRPRPSLRVFGRFALPDVFVGTHVVARSPLGGKWSVEWEIEKLRCEDVWNKSFVSSPFTGETYEHYITDNASREVRIG